MKIAFVSQAIDTVLPPYQNSVGACTYGAACALSARADVRVFGTQNKHNTDSEVQQNNVRFRLLQASRKDQYLFRARSKVSQMVRLRTPISTSALLFPDYGEQVARELAKEEYDVIHVQHSSQYIPVIRQHNPRARIVLHLHAEWFSQTKPQRLAKRLEQLDLLTTVSNHITERTKRDVPSLASRCETIYNGINADEFAAERDQGSSSRSGVRRIMYAGGISPHKGIHVLLDAFRTVVRQYPNVQLDVIGPVGSYPLEETFDLKDEELIREIERFYSKGFVSVIKNKLFKTGAESDPYRNHLQTKVSGDIVDKVKFLGLIPRPELIRHYYNADVFVFPPVWDEGFGLPPVEAMAGGAAVVATRSGAVVETVQHGRTGLLVAKNDPEALAEAMLQLLRDDTLRTQMGQNGRQRALSSFTWDHVAGRMYDRYQALCSRTTQVDLSSLPDSLPLPDRTST